MGRLRTKIGSLSFVDIPGGWSVETLIARSRFMSPYRPRLTLFDSIPFVAMLLFAASAAGLVPAWISKVGMAIIVLFPAMFLLFVFIQKENAGR
jgi:hypothetical protein